MSGGDEMDSTLEYMLSDVRGVILHVTEFLILFVRILIKHETIWLSKS
jgi:hypothetical protein